MAETTNGAAAGTAQPKLFGARVKRVEDPRFLTGQGRYVDDFTPAGARHIAFVRSHEAHADITSVDISAAQEAEGVRAVYTGADLADSTLPITCNSMYPSWQKTEFHALAQGRVRFVGEAIAAVVADDRYLAEDAAEDRGDHRDQDVSRPEREGPAAIPPDPVQMGLRPGAALARVPIDPVTLQRQSHATSFPTIRTSRSRRAPLTRS